MIIKWILMQNRHILILEVSKSNVNHWKLSQIYITWHQNYMADSAT